MRIIPGTAVLWRDPTTVQIGSDPSKCVVFTQVTSAQREWLVQAASCSPEDPPVRMLPHVLPLVSRLRAAHLIDEGEAPAMREGICIDGLDALSVRLVELLIRSGFSRFEFRDPRPSIGRFADLMPADTFATCRAYAAGEMIRARFPHVFVGSLSRSDLTVVSRPRSFDLAACGFLLADDQQHLVMTRHERSVVIGPLVIPGHTPCAQCAALALVDTDASWPLLATQMEQWPVGPLPPACECQAALCAATAVARTLGYSVLGESEMCGPDALTAHVDSDGQVRLSAIAPHERCGCGAYGTPFEDAVPSHEPVAIRAYS